jgi:hypothetical protein
MPERKYLGRAYRSEDGAIDLEAPADEVAETKKAVVDPGIRVSPAESVCNKDEALRTMDLLELGTRQGFLSRQLSLEETATRLRCIDEKREACEAGDLSACEALGQLVQEMMERGE